jgi:hypothetical protein
MIAAVRVLKDGFTACALALAGLELWLQCFRIRTWEQAGYRILLLGVIAAGLALLPWQASAAPSPESRPRRLWWLAGIASVLLLWDAAAGVIAIKHTVQTDDIRMDQGQSTLKAAQGLWHGENPYGEGALLDPYGYMARLGLRIAAGVGPHDVGPEVEPMLWRYWATHDPDLRARLLPPPPQGASAAAVRETAILGYKYGPVPLLATALMAPALGPLAVTATNVVLTFALYALVWLILRSSALPVEFAALGFIAVLADHFPVWYYMHFSDSDVWPLVFCALAVLAMMRGWQVALGAALGLALACKLFPSALYLPLLLVARSWRAAIACAAVALALFVPFALWDPSGFAGNFFLWTWLMQPDVTSWIGRVPPALAWAIRCGIAALVVALYWRLVLGRDSMPFRTLALINVAIVAAGTVIHNNYVPWFSIWAALAVAASFAPSASRRPAVATSGYGGRRSGTYTAAR